MRASRLKNESAGILVLIAIVVGARHLQANDQVSRLFTGSFYAKPDRRMADPDANGVRRIGYIVSGTDNDHRVRYFALVEVAPSGFGWRAHLPCIRPIDAWVNASPDWDGQCVKAP